MTATASPALTRVGQVSINAKDLPRAVRFYREVLGMRHLFDAGPALSFFDCGGIRLMISAPEKPEYDHPGSVIYYKVDDIQSTYEAFRARGAPFIDAPHLIARMPDHELWMAFLKDTEGNTLALMSEVRNQG
jgi:methylmalonyl-CoA/ethylmalonyl-CoA epimerase